MSKERGLWMGINQKVNTRRNFLAKNDLAITPHTTTPNFLLPLNQF